MRAVEEGMGMPTLASFAHGDAQPSSRSITSKSASPSLPLPWPCEEANLEDEGGGCAVEVEGEDGGEGEDEVGVERPGGGLDDDGLVAVQPEADLSLGQRLPPSPLFSEPSFGGVKRLSGQERGPVRRALVLGREAGGVGEDGLGDGLAGPPPLGQRLPLETLPKGRWVRLRPILSSQVHLKFTNTGCVLSFVCAQIPITPALRTPGGGPVPS